MTTKVRPSAYRSTPKSCRLARANFKQNYRSCIKLKIIICISYCIDSNLLYTCMRDGDIATDPTVVAVNAHNVEEKKPRALLTHGW